MWRLEVWNRNTGRAMLPGNLYKRILPFCFHLLVFFGLWQQNSSLWLHVRMIFPSLCLRSVPFFPTGTPVIGFRTDSKSVSCHFEILNLIVTAKILFPNRVTFIDMERGRKGLEFEHSFFWGIKLNSLHSNFSQIQINLWPSLV